MLSHRTVLFFSLILLTVSCASVSESVTSSSINVFDGITETDWEFTKTVDLHINDQESVLNLLNNDTLPIFLVQELKQIINAFQNIRSWINSNSLSQCEEDVMQLLLGIQKGRSWALHMLDSFGKPGSGIYAGNLRWPGSFAMCNGIVVTDPVNFTGKYCWLSAELNKSLVPDMPYVPPLSTAICIPNTCSEKAVLQFFQIIFRGLAKYLTVNGVSCKVKMENIGNDPKAVTSLVIISLFLTIILIGTVADVAHRRWAANSIKEEPLTENVNDNFVGSEYPDEKINSVNIESTSLNINNSQLELVSDSQKEHHHHILKRKVWLLDFFESFSLYSNGLKIFGTRQEKGTLPCLHGIRFLSMCWVIMGHTVLSVASFLQNPADALPVLKTFLFQPVMQATFSVDSFFVLSGLLLTFMYLKEYNKSGPFSKLKWLKFYIHRYLRLTPTYMLVLFVFWNGLFKHFSYGPFWPSNGLDRDNCERSWWRNILYINNFQNVSDMCMVHTWYLANDMQFFLISPLFLFFLTRSVPIAAGIGSMFILGAWITTGILASQNNVTAVVEVQNLAVHGLADPSIGFDTIYDKPYCRIPAYLIGMGCGWLLHKTNCQARMHWAISLLGWITSIVCITTPVFGLYHAHPSPHISALYGAVTRSVWALGLSWIIFACCTGYGGIVNRILSWSVWMPFSRLTYCAYLLHELVVSAVYFSMDSLRYFSITNMIYDFFGHLVFSYMISIAVCLLFEAPLLSLEKKILDRKR